MRSTIARLIGRSGTSPHPPHPQDRLATPYVTEKRVNGVPLKLYIATEEGRLWYDPPQTRATGEWVSLELATCTELGMIEPGTVVFDVGANNGVMALYFAAGVGPSGHVYAIDPFPHNVEIIHRNCELNGVHNVTAIEAAAGDGMRTTAFDRDTASVVREKVPPEGRVGNVTEPTANTVELSLDSLDAPPPKLLKIDVEGYEAAVLRGARGVLASTPHLLIELHPAFAADRFGESVTDVVALVDWERYDAHVRRPQTKYALEPWRPGMHLADAGQLEGVWLFARALV